MREIIIDIETTGLNHKKGDRIIELACVELINHITTGKHLQFYCSTKKTISNEASNIHGLSNNFLNKFPSFSEQVQNFLSFIKEDTLIIHNSDFDIGFINNELVLLGYKVINNKVIDTVLLARKKLNTRLANLDYLCKRFSIDLSGRKFHGALLDCQLLSEVYLELLGGRQISLGLKETIRTNNNLKQNNNILKNKIHQIPISTNEIKEHKNFIADLKNALWHKVNY